MELAEKHPYYIKNIKNKSFHFLDGTLEFIVYIYEHEVGGLSFNLIEENEFSKKSMHEYPVWCKELYNEFYNYFEQKDRLKRITENKQIDAETIIFFATLLEEEGKKITESFWREKSCETKNKKLAEKIINHLSKERYKAKIEESGNAFKIKIL